MGFFSDIINKAKNAVVEWEPDKIFGIDIDSIIDTALVGENVDPVKKIHPKAISLLGQKEQENKMPAV